ncbi:hypothetical protein COP2_040811 [Malus domestica]
MVRLSKPKLLEKCQVSPPPNSSAAPKRSLPLTFLDIPWLFFSPSLPLFFYDFPFPTSHFTSTALPNLKHSLSLALQQFYPFAGALLARPHLEKPELLYTQGDSVSLTVAESDGDFEYLSSNSQRDAVEFHTLVPELASTGSIAHCSNEARAANISLLSVQITVFPNCGICIGIAYHHVVGDERTFNNFIKAWASFSRLGDSSNIAVQSAPYYDRTAIVDALGFEDIFLKEWWKRISSRGVLLGANKNAIVNGHSKNMIRATFLIDLAQMESIKNWIIELCNKGNESHPAIGNTIKKLDKAILGGAEKWISEWEEMFGSELHVMVLGSPKVDLYETDFGWGRPGKIEEIGIDGVTGISLSESRDMSGGIEVGLVLPKPRMDAFTTLIIEGLNAIS